ncbi:M16 family metallopeptidase [Neomegalonema perideroedes]|uniref:M16 family metallopeptidase n=1 Tax=Neomegalonema perideroedes TaxID=217219 RepID=UPI000381B6D8|nr:pitrilysin family protein [Neomegalonema perideroedes]
MIRVDRLPNGLRVATERMAHLESAALGVFVDVGARSEAPAENGAAHFLEHMAFKGTRRRSARRIAEEIENVGGWINAYTARESTAYVVRVLAGDVPLGLDILADILRDSVFDPQELEREREVILQEIGECFDTPDDVLFEWLQEVSYEGQPLGRSILGTRKTVKALKREQIQGYMGKHYKPGSMVVAAAGAVDHDQILKLVEGLFGDMAPEARAEFAPARFTGGVKRKKKSLEQAHVAFSLPAPGALEAEKLGLAQVYATAMGGGMSSRLFQEIREKRGLCYTVSAFAQSQSDSGEFTVYAGVGEARIGEAMGALVDELQEGASALSEEEAARARAQIRASILMSRESPMSRAERLARQLLTYGRVVPTEETLDRVDSANAAKLRDFGADLLKRAPALALYGPIDKALETEAFVERLAG